jgi:hypothetical protein
VVAVFIRTYLVLESFLNSVGSGLILPFTTTQTLTFLSKGRIFMFKICRVVVFCVITGIMFHFNLSFKLWVKAFWRDEADKNILAQLALLVAPDPSG